MAKRFVSPAALFLHDAGKFLYGDLEGDLAPFAADLGTKADTLRKYFSGRTQLAGDHVLVERALGLVLNRLNEQERKWRTRADELPDLPDGLPKAPRTGDVLIAPNGIVVVSARQEGKTLEQERQRAGVSGVRRHK